MGIYGIGAICIILFSQYFSKNNFTLFLGGAIIGSITEYSISFLTEVIMQTRWWDYANNILNINGRICLLYSFFWGILTVFLMKIATPFLERIMKKIQSKISTKLLKGVTLATIIFLAINCLLTCYAQQKFITRMVIEHHIEVENREEVLADYNKTYGNDILDRIIRTLWSDNKMIKTFPNMKIEDKNVNTIYLDSLLPEIQPYYLKIFNK